MRGFWQRLVTRSLATLFLRMNWCFDLRLLGLLESYYVCLCCLPNLRKRTWRACAWIYLHLRNVRHRLFDYLHPLLQVRFFYVTQRLERHRLNLRHVGIKVNFSIVSDRLLVYESIKWWHVHHFGWLMPLNKDGSVLRVYWVHCRWMLRVESDCGSWVVNKRVAGLRTHHFRIVHRLWWN